MDFHPTLHNLYCFPLRKREERGREVRLDIYSVSQWQEKQFFFLFCLKCFTTPQRSQLYKTAKQLTLIRWSVFSGLK